MNYGYDFIKINSGGLGAIIHDIMNAVKYTHQNNLNFCFTKEGYEIPRFNGSIEDVDIPNKYWHSYFTSFPILERDNCKELWPNFLPDTRVRDESIEYYSHLLNDKIFLLKPEIESEINVRVAKTPFCPETDIVLHIRMTDKITEIPRFLPIDTYIKECEYVLRELNDETNRIYICTDDKSVCKEIQDYFYKKNIDVVWDDTETSEPLQKMRWSCKLEKSRAQEETMNAFKNLFIMKNAKYLIGGRMSYFFRIAELLRFPKKTVNMQDNQIFGLPPYSDVKYMIRPYYEKTIVDFINPLIDNVTVKKYNSIYNEENIVVVPNFISENVLNRIKPELENYQWWSYAITPNDNIWEVKYYSNINDPILKERFIECDMMNLNKYFCYRFKRDLGNHYNTCHCITCKLYATIGSFPLTDMLCKIVGCRNMTPGEIFLSNYGKDDFLSIHHDIKKGDISVTFSLTYDWHPTYGGILHFCDENKNIFKSIVPYLGSLTIFKLDPENGIHHFVSTVNVDKNRYTLTAWYNILN